MNSWKRSRRFFTTLIGASAFALSVGAGAKLTASAEVTAKPNILFIIMDDVGIDQMKVFGFGGSIPASLPNIDRIAKHGVMFTNVWAMPECSSSRAAFFTGRYPLRTGVDSAIVRNHLPQTYVSSFKGTIPRLLTRAGYTNALIGKYHLVGEKDPAGSCSPSTRGWQAFRGNNSAGPPSVDQTGGNLENGGNLICGYDQSWRTGACYRKKYDGTVSCQFITLAKSDAETAPARTCLQAGGLFRAGLQCGDQAPTAADFDLDNGYYVWPRTVTNGVRPPLSTAACASETQNRTYMSTTQSDDAVTWWKKQLGPRMLTVSYNAIHTPYQKAPTYLVRDPGNPPIPCNNAFPPRQLVDSILEGMDVEIGRMLAELGLGTLKNDGKTLDKLTLGGTMIVIVGDNGSQGGAVRVGDGFDPARAKATVYQTGVWVPLIIAGANVTEPGREVDALVNSVDLYGLFADVAGVNAAEVVPPSRLIDSRPLLPYLTSASPNPVRKTNFTQVSVGTFTPVESERSWPCQVSTTCNDTLFATEGLCLDNGGTWYGPGGAQSASSCCAVGALTGTSISIIPVRQYAVRDKRYKLVELEQTDCSAPLATNASSKPFPWAEYKTKTTREFYDLKPTASNPIGLDQPDGNFLKDCPEGQDPVTCLPAELQSRYSRLADTLDRTIQSGDAAKKCQAKGDGNLDQRVNQADLDAWAVYDGKGPSRYDINLDAQTDSADRDIIAAHLGLDCLGLCARADLDRNGKVGPHDMAILKDGFASKKACHDDVLCNGDLDGNGKVDAEDVAQMTQAASSCAPKSAER